MRIGMIGLGRMGANMVRRLLRGGHECVVHDHHLERTRALESEGAIGAASIEDLVARLPPPRVVWVMVPAGASTRDAIAALGVVLRPGDTVVDGGNSSFKDDLGRAAALAERGIAFVDVGTSGGVFGLERGYCLMIGGEHEPVASLRPVFETLAPQDGYLHCGPVGAGHFVKMVHNGIEYGLMQAYAEGFDILRGASAEDLPPEQRYRLPLAGIAELWRHGSVITSWLLDLAAAALARDPDLARYTGHVADSGEGRLTVVTAIEEAVPTPAISAALYARFRSRQQHSFGERLLSALRESFGGHQEPG